MKAAATLLPHDVMEIENAILSIQVRLASPDHLSGSTSAGLLERRNAELRELLRQHRLAIGQISDCRDCAIPG
jgi:hypothetical protein